MLLTFLILLPLKFLKCGNKKKTKQNIALSNYNKLA